MPVNETGVLSIAGAVVSGAMYAAESVVFFVDVEELQPASKAVNNKIKRDFLISVKLSAFKDAYFIFLPDDKRKSAGFKGQSNVPEEASLTST